MKRYFVAVGFLGVLATTIVAPVLAAEPSGGPATLDGAFDAVHASRFVDLTHSFAPGIPHFSGFGDETVETIATIPKDGFTAQIYRHVGQWGTHVDAPAHFHEGLRTVDQIDPKDFLLKLVVLDVHDRVATNPDYCVSMKDVAAWETRHGKIPQGAFVALRTDWSKRWPDIAAMQNKDQDGVTHYPGWSLEVLKYLYDVRGVTAIGHETTDTDPGVRAAKDDFSLESYALGTNHYQIEMLTNLDQVPEAGALIMVSFPKPEHGAGFPARAIAIVR
jgi:kynurenine formamidase